MVAVVYYSMSSKTLIPYIGGKSSLSDWIVEQFPEHKCYAEAFGGSGAVLFNKERSDVEVYNDTFGEIVNFMEVLRNQPEELEETVGFIPYSRELYNDWQEHILMGVQPEDDVERAARFFLISQASFNADFTSNNGFKTRKRGSQARTFEYKKSDLKEFGKRLNGVTIENLDYKEVMKTYDMSETLHYLDPPYVEVGDAYYNYSEEFNHSEFIQFIQEEIEGYVLISYGEEIPDIPGDWYIVSEQKVVQDSNHIENDEVLIANYNPEEVESWSGENPRIDFDF